MESCLEVGLSALAQPRLTKGGQPYPLPETTSIWTPLWASEPLVN